MKKNILSLIIFVCFISFLIGCDEEHVHNWLEVSRIECSCTEDGKVIYLCNSCDAEKQITVEEAMGHLYTEVVTEPTYENEGYTTHNCIRCDNYYIDSYVSKLEHIFSDEWTYDEYYHWHVCDDFGYEDLYISRSEHEFESVVINPTFENNGCTKYTCVTCDYYYYDSYVSKLEHNFSSECSYDEYYHWYACVDLGYEDLYIGRSEHEFESVVIDPTGVAEGYEMHTCTECNYVYKDNFEPALTYTITWKNWDGTVLETDNNVKYGVVPTYDGNTPTKSSNTQYSYIFDGWDKNIDEVTGDATYIAKFRSEVNVYNITWKNWDGTVLEVDENMEYGTIPTYDGTIPTKESDAQYSYIFNHWDSNIGVVTGDITYTAQFISEVNKYTITWENWDGSLLAVVEVEYGIIPEYTQQVYKNPTEQIEYIFIGWSPDLVPVVDHATYVACFIETVRCYNITFDAGEGYFDGDMSVHTKTISCAYGSIPQFNDIPAGFSREYGVVTFTEWNKAFETVYSDQTYVASYSYSKRNAFCIEYEYDSNNRTVGFYTPADYTGSGSGYNYIWEVDWGDGTTVDKKNKSHTYSIACKGTYYIRFYSTNSGYVSFNNSEGKWNGNKNIKRIDVYKTLTSCNYSFSGLSNVEVINFYEYTPISYCMFNGCKNLKSVKFTSTSGYIDSFAFQSCESLEYVDLGTTTITEIRESAFSYCYALKSFILPASVRKLGDSVFTGCKFTSFVIESGSKLTNIPYNAFSRAEFTTFTIPKTVTTIGYWALSSCSNLRTINYQGTMQDFLNININDNAFPASITSIRCSDGVLEI